jgi:hypothetical protein
MCSTESEPETDQPTLEEIAGLYLFTPNERAVYFGMKADSKDMSRTKKEQNIKRGRAVVKLRNVIDKRMPNTEKLVLEANKQAETDRKYQENIQFIEKALSIATPKQREIYDTLLAGATDPEKTPTQQKNCAKNAMGTLRRIVAKQDEEEKRATMTPEELAMYENEPERVAAKAHTARIQKEADTKRAENQAVLCDAGDPDALAAKAHKARLHKESKTKRAENQAVLCDAGDPDALAAKAHTARIHKEGDAKRAEKEATLCNAGDVDALARRAATNEAERKRKVAMNQRKREEEAKTAKIFPESARVSTVFGEGDERQESLTRTVEEIMGRHAGSAHPSGKPTSKKWVKDHGDVYVGVKLAEGEYAAYLGITRTTVDPGIEERCRETKAFITDVQRDPLWRMLQKDGDLKRMSPKQAKSVVNVYLLAKYENPYDATSLEGACQFYLENLGLPHGICLHKRAGAGNRLKDSMTDDEYELLISGKIKGWSLTLTMIRTTDRVYADSDPDDPERSPPLIAASIPTDDGKTVYRILVRGNKQRFPDTPSVVADRATNKAKYQKDKERRQNRKRNAAEPSDSAESSEEMEEETAKKRKI